MIELLLKLIDRCIDLAQRRELINRKLYEDFVQPTFAIVEAVYQDYSESLKVYRDTIEKTHLWTPQAEESITALITKDRLFSEALLIKLRALSNLEIKTGRLPSIENFVDAVKNFIFVPINSWTMGNAESYKGHDPETLMWPENIVWRDSQGELHQGPLPLGKSSLPRSLMSSTPRGALIQGVKEILRANVPQEEKKLRMIRTLDDILEALLVNYSLVVNEHMMLRKEALKPR